MSLCVPKVNLESLPHHRLCTEINCHFTLTISTPIPRLFHKKDFIVIYISDFKLVVCCPFKDSLTESRLHFKAVYFPNFEISCRISTTLAIAHLKLGESEYGK